MGAASGVITRWLDSLLSLIYPNTCIVCDTTLTDGERHLCLNCLVELPLTGIHGAGFNDFHKRLAGHTLIERTASMFYYYTGSPYCKIIHEAKYNERPAIAKEFARQYADTLLADGFFDGIDLILPVPIHYLKRIRRGYNQSDYIALGLSEATGIPIGDNLIARRGHSTQTRKDAFSRHENIKGVYGVKSPAMLVGLHVLIVDDILTTGSTLTACADAIHAASPDTRISVLTLAATHSR